VNGRDFVNSRWFQASSFAKVVRVSRLRDRLKLPGPGELETPAEADAKPFEVFVQLRSGQPHIHAGTVDAVDAEIALQYAREHYGQDQACIHIWVAPREAIYGTDYDTDIITRLTDRSYRYARGYQVRRRWEQFRTREAVTEYEKEDLKEAF
jgi:ring-1,2-phenylacetyl-CoA epoxidase subunit PaaB